MKKQILALTLSVVLAASVLAACVSEKESTSAEKASENVQEETLPESTKVILNEVAHSIFYAPMYVAIEEGYFAAEGIDLELVTGFGGL